MIDNLATVLRAQHFFGHRKTNRVGDPLTQRAGGDFNRVQQEVFRVACSQRAGLAEVLDLLVCDLRVTHEIQQGIDQHGAVTRRQDEAVAVCPFRGIDVELHVLFKQHGGNISHADRHARVAGVRTSNGIQRQGADGCGFVPMVGVFCAQGCQIH